jgi:hypothetical protein
MLYAGSIKTLLRHYHLAAHRAQGEDKLAIAHCQSPLRQYLYFCASKKQVN